MWFRPSRTEYTRAACTGRSWTAGQRGSPLPSSCVRELTRSWPHQPSYWARAGDCTRISHGELSSSSPRSTTEPTRRHSMPSRAGSDRRRTLEYVVGTKQKNKTGISLGCFACLLWEIRYWSLLKPKFTLLRRSSLVSLLVAFDLYVCNILTHDMNMPRSVTSTLAISSWYKYIER